MERDEGMHVAVGDTSLQRPEKGQSRSGRFHMRESRSSLDVCRVNELILIYPHQSQLPSRGN